MLKPFGLGPLPYNSENADDRFWKRQTSLQAYYKKTESSKAVILLVTISLVYFITETN